MIIAIPLAWLQLTREKLRLLVALSGVGFAVVLIFMQLGFREALFDSAVRYHTNLVYDIALINPTTDFIVQPDNFSRRRLFQVRGFPGVDSVSSVYLGQALWKNPAESSESRIIFVVGFNPSDEVFALPGFRELTPKEILDECRVFIDHIDADGIIFRSNHVSNYLALAGTLQKSKPRLLDEIDAALALADELPKRPVRF